MHRNTYLLVSILAVIAALVVGVNVGKKITTAPQITQTEQIQQTTTPTPIPQQTTQIYTSRSCGFSIEYTSGFTLTEGASNSAILQNNADKNDTIVTTCQKDIPTIPLPPDKIESLTISASGAASISAKLYHDTSNENGTPIDALIFTNPKNGLDIFVAGFGPAFNAAIKTLRVL